MNEKILKEGAATRVRNGVGGKLYLTSQKLSFKGHDFNIGEKEFEVGLEKISDVSAKGINRLCILLKDGTREDFRVYGKDVWVDIIKNTITLLSNSFDSYSDNKTDIEEKNMQGHYKTDNEVKFEEKNIHGYYKVYNDVLEVETYSPINIYSIKYEDIKTIKIFSEGTPVVFNSLYILLNNNENFSFYISIKTMEKWEEIVAYISKYNSNENKKLVLKNNDNKVEVKEHPIIFFIVGFTLFIMFFAFIADLIT